MEISNKNLAETFSASSNDSDPSIGEIRKKSNIKKAITMWLPIKLLHTLWLIKK